MIETFELRSSPNLKIILKENEFEIADISEPKNNGIYTLSNIKSVSVNKEQTNWYISIISLITDLFLGSGVGGNFKDKAHLKIKLHDNRTIRLWLINTNRNMALSIAELLIERRKLQNL